MTDVRERLRQRIEYTIRQSGLSRKQVAESLGVSQVSIHNWVTGKNAPDFETLVKFCDMFDVSLNVIYGLAPVDDEKRDTVLEKLYQCYEQLNLTGRLKLADLADDLVASGKYKPYEP